MSSVGWAQQPVVDAVVPKIEGYQIVAKLGQGGMGSVWRAVQLGTRREVALKIMSDAVPDSEQDRARFEREVELSARLNHPHIARVYDSGVDRGVYYYAMQLIEGMDLHNHVQQHDLSQRAVLQLVRAICQAIQHAHQNGVIHRDLKPSNIIVSEDGQPHVVDFGLAIHLRRAERDVSITHAGEFAGTLAYMSPEQITGQRKLIDTRADVYALGVILYRLLTGNFPHDLMGAPLTIYRRIAEEDPRQPSVMCPEIDTELEALMLKALAKEPGDRYASVGQLAQDLDNYLRNEPISAKPLTLTYYLRKRLRKYSVPIAVAMAIIMAVVALVAVGYWRERNLRHRAVEQKQVAQRQTQLAQQANQRAQQALYFNHISLAEAYAREHIDRARELLRACPTHLRHWEWHYLMRLTDQSTQTLPLDGRVVIALAFGEQGSKLVAADDRSVQVWNSAEADPSMTIDRRQSDPRAVAISPDGQRVAGVNGQAIVVWDVRTGRQVKTLEAVPRQPRAVAFTANSSTLVWANATQVTVWDLVADQASQVLRGHDATVKAMAISPAGRRLAIVGWSQSTGVLPKRVGVVVVWNLSTGQPLTHLTDLDTPVESVAFAHDGRALAYGTKEGITLIDPDTGHVLCQLDGAGDALAFEPNGRFLATSDGDSAITLWDIQQQTIIRTLHGHSGPLRALAFSPNGYELASSSTDGTIKRWDMTTGPDVLPLNLPDSTAISPDGQWVAWSDGESQSSVRIVHITDRGLSAPTVIPSGDQPERVVAISPSTHRLLTATGESNTTYRLRDADSGQVIHEYTDRLQAATFSPDGQHLAAVDKNRIMICDAVTGRPTAVLHTQQKGSIRALAFGKNSQCLVSAGDDATVRVWDRTTNQILSTSTLAPDEQVIIAGVNISPDGQHVFTEDIHGQAMLWRPSSNDPPVHLSRHATIQSWAFSPDNQYLALGGYGTIRLVDTRTGQTRLTLEGHQEFVRSLAFTPDGKRLASGGDDTKIKLWDPTTGTEVLTLDGHLSGVTFLAFSGDGRRLTSASNEDGQIRFWRHADHRPDLRPSLQNTPAAPSNR